MFSKRQNDNEPEKESIVDRRIREKFTSIYPVGKPIPAEPETEWAKAMRAKVLALADKQAAPAELPVSKPKIANPLPVVEKAQQRALDSWGKGEEIKEAFEPVLKRQAEMARTMHQRKATFSRKKEKADG